MSRILKKKRFISFLLALFISFSVLTNLKKKEAQAFDFVVTPTVLWSLGALVLGTGVVALNHEQVTNMGEMVYYKFKDLGGKDTELFNVVDGVAKGVVIMDKVISSVDWVSTNLPSISLDKLFPSESLPSTGIYNFMYNLPLPVFSYSDYVSNKQVVVGSFVATTNKINWRSNNKSIGYFSPKVGEPLDILIKLSSYSGIQQFNIFITKSGSHIFEHIFSAFSYSGVPSYPSSIPLEFDSVDNFNNILTIPYDNPKIKENYQPGLLPNSIPYTDTKPGYMPVPLTIPTDIPITTDIPLTWDSVKDKVTDLPLDVPLNPPIDIPGVGDIDTPIDRPIDGVVDDIYNPTFSTNLDLSPLYIDLTKKFPFSIPFDFLNLMNNFSVAKERPVVKITFPEQYYNSYTIDIDLAFYDDYFPFSLILRYFLLIAFMYFLMKNTRKIMGA